MGFLARRWCEHEHLESVECHVAYLVTWRCLLTNEEGYYSESEGKFRCLRCNSIVLGRFSCLTNKGTDPADDEDDGDEDPNAEGALT